MSLSAIEIRSSLRNYAVNFCSNEEFIKKLAEIKNAVFVIDEKVWQLYGSTIFKPLEQINKILFPALEDRKNLDGAQFLYDEIIKLSPKKNLTVVSIGGGIIQDVSGFTASTLYRGVKWIFVPTTLLAQDDSCVGAKTSLNYKNFKNLIGTFFPPNEVYIFSQFLKTLSDADFASGVGEMAKLHLLSGKKDALQFQNAIPAIFARDEKILTAFIQRCLEIKKSYIEEDEFDEGRRNLLNYGHCFGHGIESSTNFAIPHGQAVVIGMIMANIAALNRKIISAELEKFIREKILTEILRLDFSVVEFDVAAITKAMAHDKKNTGSGFALIVMNDDYEFKKLSDLSISEAEAAINQFRKLIA